MPEENKNAQIDQYAPVPYLAHKEIVAAHEKYA
jgi:hypothetical protein